MNAMTNGKLGAKAVSACALLLLSACGGGGGSTAPTPPPDGTGTVGSAGGTVTLSSGAAVTIPAGALAGDRAITVAADGTNGPSGNPRYRFGPAGTTFTSPVTVTLPRPAGLAVGASASVYWTKVGSETTYDALPATVTAAGVTAQVTHFSLGFVGAACVEGAACTEGMAACQAGAVACASGAPVCAAGGAVADGTGCGAATACAAASTCQAGSCVAGQAVSCDDGNACTADACDAVSGCSHANVTDGTACGGGTCSAGSCVADAFDSTALGATMTYQVTPPAGAAYRTTFEVVATAGDTFTRKVTRSDQATYALNDLVRNGTGAYVVQTQSLAANGTALSTVTYSPPLLFYPATVAPGAVETRTSTLGGSGTGDTVVTVTVTVAGRETLVTGLGTFQAFKTTTINSAGGSSLVGWWAPGIGRVKWQASSLAAPAQVTTYELVAFGSASATCPAQGSVCAAGQVCLATGCTLACELTSCAPTAQPDQAVVRNGAPVLIDVLANDGAPRGGLSLVSATTPTSGTVAVVAGKLQFTPPSAGATGTASFSYTATDGVQTATAAVTVTMAQTLTVTGQVAGVALPGGRAGLWYGQVQSEGTLDASGAYTATIDVVDRSAIIFATAIGDPASGQGSVTLLSMLGSFDALGLGQAGPLVITAAEYPGVTLSPLSLARYGAVGQANGLAIPTTDLQIVEAERSVSSTQLLDIAAAVKLSVDQPTLYPAPVGQDWLFLTTDPAVLKAYQAQVAAAAGSTAPLDEARAALLADPQVVPPITVPSGGATYYVTYATTPGYFPRGGELLELAADGTGSLLDTEASRPLTWQVIDGALQIELALPITFVSFPLVKTLPLSAEVKAAYAPLTQVEQTDTLNTIRFQPVLIGIRQRWVEQTLTGTTTWPPVVVGGVTVNPSAPASATYQVHLRDARLNPAIPFTAALATGTWGTNAFYSPGNIWPALTPLPAWINADLLTLTADGTGSATKSGRTLTWTITAGDLAVTYSDGAKQTMRILAERPGQHLVFSFYREAGGALRGSLDLAFKQDPAFLLTGAAVATAAGEYWSPQHNFHLPYVWVDGQPLPLYDWFGWELYAAGTGLQLSGDMNGDGVFDRANESAALAWSVVGDEIEVVRFPAAADSRRALRYWYPLSMSADGNTFYAIEEEVRRTPATNPYGFMIPPRLVFFHRWPSP